MIQWLDYVFPLIKFLKFWADTNGLNLRYGPTNFWLRFLQPFRSIYHNSMHSFLVVALCTWKSLFRNCWRSYCNCPIYQGKIGSLYDELFSIALVSLSHWLVPSLNSSKEPVWYLFCIVLIQIYILSSCPDMSFMNIISLEISNWKSTLKETLNVSLTYTGTKKLTKKEYMLV